MNKSFSTYFDTSIPFAQRYDIIKRNGFDAVMILWQDSPQGEDRAKQVSLARSHKLYITNMHADYTNINSLWLEDGTVHNHLAQCVIDCNHYGIDTVVMHLSSTNTPPVFNSLGLSRLEKVVNLAVKYNVKLAFENLRQPHYNKFVYDNFDCPQVGLCYDCGHENIYCKGYDVIEYLNREVFTSHLHDNNGIFDHHLLPFEGTVNWDNTIAKLQRAGQHSINIESRNIKGIDNDQFVSKAYQCARQLETMLMTAGGTK